MSLADQVRDHAFRKILAPALTLDGVARVRAGDVHRDMGLVSRMPSVCGALASREMERAYGLKLVGREGPFPGANAVFHFSPAAGLDGASAPLAKPDLIERSVTAAPPRAIQPASRLDFAGALVLVSCVKTKLPRRAPARDLYCSTWFLAARDLVEAKRATWRILSARYGLVDPHQVIDPYEETLKGKPVAERRVWADTVSRQVEEEFGHFQRVIFLAGQTYREFLAPRLRSRGVEVVAPMERLSQGFQPGWMRS